MQYPEPEACDKVFNNNLDGIGIWKCWFLRRGENQSNQRKTCRSKDENQQQTQPTCQVWESNPGHIGGRRVLSRLLHICSFSLPDVLTTKPFLLKIPILGYCHFLSSPDTPQEKVIKVVPDDLLSPSTEVAPLFNRNTEPDAADSSRAIQ